MEGGEVTSVEEEERGGGQGQGGGLLHSSITLLEYFAGGKAEMYACFFFLGVKS